LIDNKEQLETLLARYVGRKGVIGNLDGLKDVLKKGRPAVSKN
jgi:hypothetical protein